MVVKGGKMMNNKHQQATDQLNATNNNHANYQQGLEQQIAGPIYWDLAEQRH